MITKKTPKETVLELGRCSQGKGCEECKSSCQMGSGCFTEEQIFEAARFLGLKEEEFKDKYLEEVTKFNTTLMRPKQIRDWGKPYGRCVFFDEKEGCSIHKVKPLECKISNHSEMGEALHLWFTLNYFVNETDPESIRQWANYIEMGGKLIPGGSLVELVPNEKTLKKIMSYRILR